MAVVGAIVGAGAAAYVGYTAVVIVGAAVVGAVLFDYASDMFTPDIPDFGGGSAAEGMLVNKAANDAPIPVVYGQRKVGGTRVFIEVTGNDNEYLHLVLALAEGEIDSVQNVYLNDINITDDRFNATDDEDDSSDATIITDIEQSKTVVTWQGNVDHILYIELDCAVSGVHTYSGSGTSGTLEGGSSAQSIGYNESPSGYESEGWHGDLSATINLTPFDTGDLDSGKLHDLQLNVTNKRGGGGVSLLQQPTPANNYKAIIKLWDHSGGEGNIAFNLVMREGTSPTTVIGGNLAQSFNHTGSDTQAADDELVANVTNWTTSHQLKGTAYLYVKLKYDQDAFTSGLPTITADIKGAKVYDPRTSTTAWSDNPALCIRDYLTSTRYGRGIDTSLIDDTTFNVAANYCDETVTIGGATVKRYTCNGVVDTSAGSMDILKKLLTSCRGFLIFSGGKYKLVINKAETATFTFSEDNIVGSWSISLGNKNSQYNRIRANFFNPDRNWQPDLAIVDSSALRTQDNGLLLEKTIDLPFTSDIDRAKMITTINLNQSRQGIICEFTSTIEGLRCEAGDVVYIKHATPGWDTLNSNSGKLFRVMKISLQSSDEVRITATEYDLTVFDFGTIAVSDASPNTNLPDPFTVQPPGAITTTESLYDTIGSGGVKVRIDIDWIAPSDIFVSEYEVQWKENGSGIWIYLTTTKNMVARLDDANPVIHDFRVRAINSMGSRSVWSYLNNVTVAGLTTPPVDVANLSFIALNNAAHLSWDLATDLDVRVGGKVRFRHSNLTTGASWESSTDIGAAVSGLNTNAVLPLLTGTYMAKFVDSTGNESVNTSSFVSTTIPNIINMNAVATSTQNPSFTGTKTNMVAVDNVLKFEADTLLDSVTELMDDWEILDAIGGLDSAGSYEFDTYIDLGAVYTSRATASIAFTAFVIGDFIDDRTALMDTWTDLENAPSDVTLNLYIATTNDDPSGTPTWSSWAKFTVADYSARAYKFKVEASSTNADHQINITELSVAVDMPDTVQGANALTSLSTGLLSVTYATPFKAIPALGVTFTDLDSNDILDIQNETTTGFDVGVKHGSNYEAHNFNYLARGY